MSIDTNMLSDEEFEAAYQKELDALGQDEPKVETNVEVEDTEEVDSDEAEQPEEDNSDNTTDEDSDQGELAEEAVEEDDESEDSDVTDETSTTETEEQSEDKDDNSTKTEAQIHKIKANGQEVEFTTEELKLMASKGMDYTKKMQRFAQHKEQISILEDAKLSNEDLNLVVDVLKGKSKESVVALLNKINVDIDEFALEDRSEMKYIPKTYGRSATELDIEEVVHNISRDPEYKTTEHVLTNRLDGESKKYFAENPEQIYVLHNDIKSGRYNQISAKADKLMQLETGKPKAYVDYYIQAGNDLLREINTTRLAEQKRVETAKTVNTTKVAEAKQKQAKIVQTKEDSTKRKAAGISTSKSTAKQAPVDYLDEDMSDDEFLKLYESKIK